MSVSFTTNNNNQNNQRSEARPPAEGSTAPEIDLEALARKIYELLKKEARLEDERLGRR